MACLTHLSYMFGRESTKAIGVDNGRVRSVFGSEMTNRSTPADGWHTHTQFRPFTLADRSAYAFIGLRVERPDFAELDLRNSGFLDEAWSQRKKIQNLD